MHVIDQLIQDTFALATPNGRVPGTQGHADAIDYIQTRFTEIGLAPYLDTGYLHTYEMNVGRATHGHNVVGVIPGMDRALAPTLIGAHYDSVLESFCADDNATSVAVMLSVAERLMATPLQGDVIIVAFDGEEPPYYLGESMGSVRFVEDVLDIAVNLAVIMDLIGHNVGVGDQDLMVVTGTESHPDLEDIVGDTDLPTVRIRNSRVGDMSDHHAFRLAGMPFLFYSAGEWEHYHTEDDIPERVNFGKMARLVGDLENTIRRADAVELGDADYVDIVDVEAQSLTWHLGDTLGDVTADDVAAVVPMLRGALRAA